MHHFMRAAHTHRPRGGPTTSRGLAHSLHLAAAAGTTTAAWPQPPADLFALPAPGVADPGPHASSPRVSERHTRSHPGFRLSSTAKPSVLVPEVPLKIRPQPRLAPDTEAWAQRRHRHMAAIPTTASRLPNKLKKPHPSDGATRNRTLSRERQCELSSTPLQPPSRRHTVLVPLQIRPTCSSPHLPARSQKGPGCRQ
jgi:hypothetical protein